MHASAPQTDWLARIDAIGPALAEGAAERDATDTFIAAHYPRLKEHGLVSMLVPAELGGGGASHATACAALRRLGAWDGPTALALSMHSHLVAALRFPHRRGMARATATLGRVAAENLVLVSTGARDWMDSSGTLERADGGYRLTAHKPFASGSPAGDVAVTSACYDHPTEGPITLVGPGVKFSKTPVGIHRLPAALGEHTEEVLGSGTFTKPNR